MATGDITSVTIRSDGWSADVVVEGFTTGATYDFGTPGDVSTSKFYLYVTSEGYASDGSLGTIQRTVYAVSTVRKPYPDHAQKNETGGGNLTVRVALSDYVYVDDNTGAGKSGSAPQVYITAGWCTNSGGASQTSNGFTNDATNNSTVTYPKVIGHFAVEQRRPVNGSHDIEVFCAHKYAQDGSPVARVEITATGATSSHVETGSATAMTLSSRGDKIPVYAVTLNLSTAAGFTRGELVNIKFKAYPWVGDASSTLDSNADAGSQIFQLGDLKWTIMSKMIAVVDGSTGNDTTGVASETQATADASPCLTINGALTKIAAANNSAYSLNRIDGGEVQCKAATYTWDKTGSQASTNGYFTIKPHSSTNRAGVVIAGNGSTKSQYAYQRFYNVTFTRSASHYTIFAANPNVLIMESVNFADAYTSWYSGDTNTNIEALDCTSNNGYFLKGGNDGHARLVRNLTYTATTESSGAAAGNASCILGVQSTSGGTKGLSKDLTSAGFNNFIIAYCKFLNASNDYIITNNVVRGAYTNMAIVCNVIERVGSSTDPLMEISDANMSNILIVQNTFTGRRVNHENDIAAAYVNKTFVDYVGKFNSFNARGDHRADVYDSDASMVGTWAVGYSAGWNDNHNEAINYSGDSDYFGIRSNGTLGSTSISPSVAAGYTSDRSIAGTNAGNGDYHPTSTSILLNRIPAGFAALPYDIEGKAFNNAGYGTIGAYQRFLPGAISLTSKTSTTINLTATEGTSGYGTIAKQWYYSTSAIAEGAGTTTGTDSLTLAMTGLTANTTYYFRVRYTDSLGNVSYSAQYSTTTNAEGGGGLIPFALTPEYGFGYAGER